jgi:hypothetical protein
MKLLTKNKEILISSAKELLKEETVDQDQLSLFFNKLES